MQLRPPRIARRLLGLDTVLQGDPQGDFPGASSARPPVDGNALDPLGDPFLGVILPQGLAAGECESNRTLWLIVVIVGMQFIGPILYFLLGKEDS